MSIEIPRNNPTESQALSMAQFAGIELTKTQVDWYIEHRIGTVDKNTPEESSTPTNLSDQQLLEKILTAKQRHIFRLRYPNIFQ